MKLLFGSQFYTPSIGGVQEVIRQLAEKLVSRGHQVTVATSRSVERNFNTLNGVAIKEFNISGNYATGMQGNVDQYHQYIIEEKFDVIMVMAAQQWTFDALWPLIGEFSKTRVVFIPCGFSGLHDPIFAEYFNCMPTILAKIDHLIFHSTDYRDINFAKEHNIKNISIIPCGASKEDFSVSKDDGFRKRHKIRENSFVFLTVGTFTGIKGHLELIKAFAKMEIAHKNNATLILNGNTLSPFNSGAGHFLHKIRSTIKTRGIIYLLKLLIKKFLMPQDSIKKIAEKINGKNNNKNVLITNLERIELIQAFINADLFVFASNIEYSPLVLFETAAAGTPFISVSVGNAEEIAKWTKAGIICDSIVDEKGYTRVDDHILAMKMFEMMENPELLTRLGTNGREQWLSQLNWEEVSLRYEEVFLKVVK
jgi:glycosyltransferase involved in cell wall biosynthesis